MDVLECEICIFMLQEEQGFRNHYFCKIQASWLVRVAPPRHTHDFSQHHIHMEARGGGI
jgi:hypothetical protein